MSLPDFMTNPNAVLGDTEDEWRYGRIPDYNKVNAAFDKGKSGSRWYHFTLDGIKDPDFGEFLFIYRKDKGSR
jgi:hypothetical protein